MKIKGKQIPAWILLLIILGAAAATVAIGASGATVLTGDTQVAVADKLVFEEVKIVTSLFSARRSPIYTRRIR